MTTVNISHITDTVANLETSLPADRWARATDGNKDFAMGDGSNVFFVSPMRTWNGVSLAINNIADVIGADNTVTLLTATTVEGGLQELNSNKVTVNNGTASSGAGVDTSITAQSAAIGSGLAGGDINLTVGSGDGAGADGDLNIVANLFDFTGNLSVTGDISNTGEIISSGTGTSSVGGNFTIGGATTTINSATAVIKNNTDSTSSYIALQSGSSSSFGANLELYYSTHTSFPAEGRLRSDGDLRISWNQSEIIATNAPFWINNTSTTASSVLDFGESATEKAQLIKYATSHATKSDLIELNNIEGGSTTQILTASSGGIDIGVDVDITSGTLDVGGAVTFDSTLDAAGEIDLTSVRDGIIKRYNSSGTYTRLSSYSASTGYWTQNSYHNGTTWVQDNVSVDSVLVDIGHANGFRVRRIDAGTATADNLVAIKTSDGGAITMAETTTPSAETNLGKIYTKTDNKLYFQDGAGTEHTIQFV